MPLNSLLHEIITHLPIPSEARSEELHAMVDEVAPEAPADAPAADTGTPGVTVDPKGK